MSDVDQRRFDNQPSDLLSAREAAALLGVQLRTLYAYASRGLLRSAPAQDGAGRRRLYLRDDLLRLRARHDARAGHGPVAAAALRWGEPVLESAITSIREGALRYRGRSALALAEEGTPFEVVAELLWQDSLPEAAPRWPVRGLGVRPAQLCALLPGEGRPFAVLPVLVPVVGAQDEGRWGRGREAVLPRARALIRRMAASLCCPAAPGRVAAALQAPTTAGTLALALGARHGEDGVRAIDRALVLCADHELNVSTFAARVAASTEADVYACVSAALAALSGAQHGAMSDRVEALLHETRRPERAGAALRERARRGEAIPGCGHTLYPEGDPRTPPLLAAARALAPREGAVRTLLALGEAMRAGGYGAPALDLGLVALSAALGLPPGSAVVIMALGRTAGWIAHVLEQYQASYLLRPRARYVGR